MYFCKFEAIPIYRIPQQPRLEKPSPEMDGWMDRCLDGWMDGWMNLRMDGRMDNKVLKAGARRWLSRLTTCSGKPETVLSSEILM